jgi:branched-chain amino acid transport system ATP-binding protein
MSTALEVHGLSVSYGRLPVVFDVDLSLPQGSVLALLGPNGAGKTTTLRACIGLVKPSSGRILLRGQEIGARHTFARARKGMCLVPEGRGIFPNLTVKENLAMHRYLPSANDEERAYDTFPVLAERRHQLAGTLSGGQQQMLALSRALTTDPSVLLLDEISMGLAPLVVDSLFGVIGGLRDNGLSIVIVEQKVEYALKLADYVALMYKGSIRAVGQPADVADRIAETYLGGHDSDEAVCDERTSDVGPNGPLRTSKGSMRHHAECIVLKTSRGLALGPADSEMPMCGICGGTTEEESAVTGPYDEVSSGSRGRFLHRSKDRGGHNYEG